MMVADAVEVTQTPHPRVPSDRNDVIEEASMEVLEVFKGEVRVGDRVAIRTEFVCCTCAMTAKNDPVWLFDLHEAGNDSPTQWSGRWLLFQFEDGPMALIGGWSFRTLGSRRRN